MAFGIDGQQPDDCAYITPAAITGAVDNWAPADAVTGVGLASASIVRQALTAASTLNGMTTGGSCRFVLLENLSTTFSWTVAHEAVSSTDINRFTLPNATNLVIPPLGSAAFVYDVPTNRFRADNAPTSAASLSGTTNTIAKFTSATTIGNSSITDDGVTLTTGVKLYGLTSRFRSTDPSALAAGPPAMVAGWYSGAGTAGDRYGVEGFVDGSFDATAGVRNPVAVYAAANATRSAGGNAVTNVAVRAEAVASAGVNAYSWYSLLGDMLQTGNATFGAALAHQGSTLGFYNTAPVTKPAVSGAGNTNALTSLLAALVSQGLISSTATPSNAAAFTVEHFSGATAVCGPTVDRTFFDDHLGGVTATLANGTADGFLKTFSGDVADGAVTLTPASFANGSTLTQSSRFFAFQLMWNATSSKWQIAGPLYNVVLA